MIEVMIPRVRLQKKTCGTTCSAAGKKRVTWAMWYGGYGELALNMRNTHLDKLNKWFGPIIQNVTPSRSSLSTNGIRIANTRCEATNAISGRGCRGVYMAIMEAIMNAVMEYPTTRQGLRDLDNPSVRRAE